MTSNKIELFMIQMKFPYIKDTACAFMRATILVQYKIAIHLFHI